MTRGIWIFRGLSLAATLAKAASFVLLVWVYAGDLGMRDDLVEGVRSIPQMVIDSVVLAVRS